MREEQGGFCTRAPGKEKKKKGDFSPGIEKGGGEKDGGERKKEKGGKKRFLRRGEGRKREQKRARVSLLRERSV